jgi:hypothetical protein
VGGGVSRAVNVSLSLIEPDGSPFVVEALPVSEMLNVAWRTVGLLSVLVTHPEAEWVTV